MGSAQPMDWVLCPVPTLVLSTVGGVQVTWYKPGCLGAVVLEVISQGRWVQRSGEWMEVAPCLDLLTV